MDHFSIQCPTLDPTCVGYPEEEDVDHPHAGGHKVPLPVLLLVRLLDSDVVVRLGLQEGVEVGVAVDGDDAMVKVSMTFCGNIHNNRPKVLHTCSR